MPCGILPPLDNDANRRTKSFGFAGSTTKRSADALSNADDDRFANVYVQDRDTGAVELASLPAAGGSGAGASIHPALSGNGRRVAFASTAQLVPQDTDTDSDVYLRDLDTGATILVSRRFDTGAQGTGVNGDPDISHDGTVVAFSSTVVATLRASRSLTARRWPSSSSRWRAYRPASIRCARSTSVAASRSGALPISSG